MSPGELPSYIYPWILRGIVMSHIRFDAPPIEMEASLVLYP